MIKVTVNEEKKIQKKEFPVIKIHNDGDLIVLFRSLESGVVIYSDCSEWSVAEDYSDWNHDAFKNYNLPVTLENV